MINPLTAEKVYWAILLNALIYRYVCVCVTLTKKCWVVLTQFWVKYGQTSHWVTFLNDIFNPNV